MNIPKFTAEAALYTKSGHYRTSRNGTNNLATRMMGVIQPAEVITVHGCRPGHTLVDNEDGSFECFPDPLTEPSGGGGFLPDSTGVTSGSPPGGGGGGRVKTKIHPSKPEKHPKKIKAPDYYSPFNCTDEQLSTEKATQCIARGMQDLHNNVPIHNVLCSGSDLLCCIKAGGHYICDVEEVKQ